MIEDVNNPAWFENATIDLTDDNLQGSNKECLKKSLQVTESLHIFKDCKFLKELTNI